MNVIDESGRMRYRSLFLIVMNDAAQPNGAAR